MADARYRDCPCGSGKRWIDCRPTAGLVPCKEPDCANPTHPPAELCLEHRQERRRKQERIRKRRQRARDLEKRAIELERLGRFIEATELRSRGTAHRQPYKRRAPAP